MPTTRELSPSRRAASAYPRWLGNNMKQLAKMGTLIALIVLVRTVFFHDYRAEQIQYLSAAGKSMDEIKVLFPPNPKERRETIIQQADDIKQLKMDVTLLKQDVQLLIRRFDEVEKNGITSKHSEPREDGLSLDEIRFKEEGDSKIELGKKETKAIKVKNMRLDLAELGQVPEGDLLSGG